MRGDDPHKMSCVIEYLMIEKYISLQHASIAGVDSRTSSFIWV